MLIVFQNNTKIKVEFVEKRCIIYMKVKESQKQKGEKNENIRYN